MALHSWIVLTNGKKGRTEEGRAGGRAGGREAGREERREENLSIPLPD